ADSNRPRAPAPTESLRLRSPRMPCRLSLQPRPAASKRTIPPCNCRAQPPIPTLQIISTCSTLYKTHRLPRRAASFKSLYLKRPYIATQQTTFTRGRFRYSTKTSWNQGSTYLLLLWGKKGSEVNGKLCSDFEESCEGYQDCGQASARR